MSVRVFDSADELASFGASWIAALAGRLLAERPRFDLACSGGRSPLALLRALARPGRLTTAQWRCVHLWFTDERAVAPDDPAANARVVLEALRGETGLPPAVVHRPRAEADDLEAAAREYETALPAALDLVVLGLGEDGHIASLFPGSPLLADGPRRVAVVRDSPKPPPRRITFTPRTLAAAREVVVLGLGAEKAEAVARALSREGSPAEVPARLLRGRHWWIDRPAAAKWEPR
jgi:6-phosphogluconolactonase